MNQRLKEEQLQQVIAEVGELSNRREAEFDRQQIQEILQELNLPPELLDEAMIQLRRRQALGVEKRRNLRIAIAGAGVVVLAIASTILFFQHQNSIIARIQAQQDQITLALDNNPFSSISRQTNSEIVYRVTLQDAPIGKKLNLSCNWIDPDGKIVKENRYQTQEITTSIWETRCRYNISSTATPGTWTVQIFLEDRLLSEETFEVR
ncbi:MAG: DUF3859 domain-containing protein [Limnoraphis robusta]|jgi:hypothetical protein|uniref:DUF3859 domain-containing protein n=1 Tax=Limnoraphis robusta CS-951 TaxID=1637645 RepID=A0A0F5YNQ5_9CYAN|nr:DUF3859 domain-containing protein [Limnoraphis robusta]KKD39820.1 hypothetical protein WN50_01255 [Limnoraphis robusta CS-951]